MTTDEPNSEMDRVHRDYVAEEREAVSTKTGMKHKAQDILMHGVAVAQGYWHEQHPHLYEALATDEARDEFQRVLSRQADRVAHLFGYEEAWGA